MANPEAEYVLQSLQSIRSQSQVSVRRLVPSGRKFLICDRCGGPNDAYMVTTEVWEKAFPGKRGFGFSCIPCLALNLGRPLAITDFTVAPINRAIFQGWLMGQQS